MASVTKKIAVWGFPALLMACSSGPQWYHSQITDPALIQRQFAIDEGQCLARANNAVNVPQIRQNRDPVHGPADAFTQGFINGMNQGAARRARQTQDRIFQGCMYEYGWMDKPPMHSALERGSVTSGIANIEVYESPRAQWLASVDEFLNVFPVYREDTEAYHALDTFVKSVAQLPEAERWTGPQVLLAAHGMVLEQEQLLQSVATEEHSVLVRMYQDAASGSLVDKKALVVLYVTGTGPLYADLERALYWAQLAAMMGDSGSQREFGFLLAHVGRTEHQRDVGFRLVKSFSESGDAEAIQMMKLLDDI